MSILKATLRREATLIERNTFIYIFRVTQVNAVPHLEQLCMPLLQALTRPGRSNPEAAASECSMVHAVASMARRSIDGPNLKTRAVQVAFNAFVTGTLFFRTRLHRNTVDDANLYLAALFFTLVAMLFNNWAEFAIISERLSLFYKQVTREQMPQNNDYGQHGILESSAYLRLAWRLQH